MDGPHPIRGEQKDRPPPARGNSLADCPWTWPESLDLLGLYYIGLQTGTTPSPFLVLHLPAYTADFGFASPHNHISQFLESLSLSLDMCTSYWFCFLWGETLTI
jgi:hypothetical protein